MYEAFVVWETRGCGHDSFGILRRDGASSSLVVYFVRARSKRFLSLSFISESSFLLSSSFSQGFAGFLSSCSDASNDIQTAPEETVLGWTWFFSLQTQ